MWKVFFIQEKNSYLKPVVIFNFFFIFGMNYQLLKNYYFYLPVLNIVEEDLKI